MSGNPPGIALVTVWFGPLPFWMPALLLSCRHNPTVDWLIFTDATPPRDAPPNVRFLPLSLQGFNQRASEALGRVIEVLPEYPYKLCDFKVLYGDIFARELSEYRVWGCCDLDVVWGDIRTFVTNKLLATHPVITTRPKRISGHCCLFRNEAKWNRLYREIPGIWECLEDQLTCRRVDENLLTELLDHSNRPAWQRPLLRLANRKRVYWKEVWTTNGQHQRDILANPELSMRWAEGRTFDANGKERMYLHFHVLRKEMRTLDFDLNNPPSSFKITPGGFHAEPPATGT